MSITKQISLEAVSVEQADEISSQILETTQKKLGFIPNMYAGMANNTALLEGYVAAYNTFRANAGFTPPEQEVVFLSIAVENGCTYCAAAHSFVGDNMTQVPTEVTDAIRNNTEIPDEKLKVLSTFSRIMTEKRGLPSEADIDAFLGAGYTEKHILGVIAAIGVKTMSNYFNHVADTPLDDVFKSRIWEKK